MTREREIHKEREQREEQEEGRDWGHPQPWAWSRAADVGTGGRWARELYVEKRRESWRTE